MRLIFLSLLVFNLLLLAWYTWPDDSTADQRPLDNASGVKQLLLLAERGGEDDRQIELTQVLGNPVALSAEPDSTLTTPACLGVGPIEDMNAAQDIAERLNSIGASVSLEARDTPTGELDHRLVMGPLNSLQESFRRLRELRAREIDSYVITEGEDAQSISLGVFSTLASAESYQQELAGMGYQARIKEIQRVSRGYWVISDEPALENVISDELAKTDNETSLIKTQCSR